MGVSEFYPLELSYFINVASWSLPCLDAWDLWDRMHDECCKYSRQNWIKFVYACGPVSFPFLSRLTLRFSMLLFTDNIEGRRDATNPSWTWTPKRRVHTWSHGLSRRLLSTPMSLGPWDVLRCNPTAVSLSGSRPISAHAPDCKSAPGGPQARVCWVCCSPNMQ